VAKHKNVDALPKPPVPLNRPSSCTITTMRK
jgi:hypothetical protein